MNKFQYKNRSEDSYKKRTEQRSGGSRDFVFKDKMVMYSPKVGETSKLRILPPTWEDADHYGYDVWVHYNVGGNKSQFLCLNRMKGQACPVCEALQTKEAQADPAYIKDLKAKRKVLVWVLDRKEEEVGPKVWLMSWKLDKNFVINARNEDTGKVDEIDHPDNGFDVYFDTVKSESKDIPFTYEGEKIARNSSPISNDPSKMESILEFLVEHPLPSILDFKSYEYIKQVLDGKATPVEEEEEEDIPIEHPVNKTPVADKFDDMNREELVEYITENYEDIPYKAVKKMSDEELRGTARDRTPKANPEPDRLSAAREKVSSRKYNR